MSCNVQDLLDESKCFTCDAISKKQLYAAWLYLTCSNGPLGNVIGDGLGNILGDGLGNEIGTGT